MLIEREKEGMTRVKMALKYKYRRVSGGMERWQGRSQRPAIPTVPYHGSKDMCQ